MTSLVPDQLQAFAAACGFLASAGFMRFVIRRPATDRRSAGRR